MSVGCRKRARDCRLLAQSLAIADRAGITGPGIVLDPSFGFAKTADENIELMRRAGEFHQFGFPLLAGTSRKQFIGTIAANREALALAIADAARIRAQ